MTPQKYSKLENEMSVSGTKGTAKLAQSPLNQKQIESQNKINDNVLKKVTPQP